MAVANAVYFELGREKLAKGANTTEPGDPSSLEYLLEHYEYAQ